MSANRKLQAEVQQVLKKLEEGIEEFDAIWEKVYAAREQNLKEKYENDLKKEIKKLQRLRDQIKSWLSGTEIKDKAPLLEARKVIEGKMEQFKICEKDTKTKAYSREGLSRPDKMDPKEAEKDEKRTWLNECLEKLTELIEQIEADSDKLASKSKSKNKEALEQLSNRIQKNKWHMGKLELILRMMDDDQLDPSKLDAIKEDVEYYIESAADDDGALGVDDEFDIYEELQLDSMNDDVDDIVAGAAVDSADKDPTSPKVGAVDDADKVKKPVVAAQPNLAMIGKAQIPPKGVTTALPLSKAPVILPKSTPAVLAGVGSPAGKGPPPSSAAAAVRSPAGKNDGKLVDGKSPVNSSTLGDKSGGDSHTLPSAVSSSKIDGTTSWAFAATQKPAGTTPVKVAAQVPVPTPTSAPAPAIASAAIEVPSQANILGPTTALPQQQSPNLMPARPSQQQQQPPAGTFTMPTQAVIGSMTSSSVPIAPQHRGSGANNIHPEVLSTLFMLKQSMTYLPEQEVEASLSSSYTPRNPHNTHFTFPTVPPPLLETPAIFEKLSFDSLFLAFYYQQGSLQQHLAAKQLKKYSWRFHKKYMTWFQRHEEPKITTDDYEEGTYVYFDYDSGWCQRIKSEFKFEYCFLEDEVQ